jgi:light-regulated signal transduction histidine kinase (bacteriophytochrome)
MRKLILDLLEYSRVGRQIQEKTEVDCNDLLYEAVKLNRAVIDEKKALIDWNKLPTVTANRTGLLQVFQNLIGNALKYQRTGESPQIKITASETDTHWQFAVSDNGIGIEERYFEKIFIVFQRLHNKDEFSGTGIGLSICKKIIENHQGRLWVESQYGKGSTFLFTLIKSNPVDSLS